MQKLWTNLFSNMSIWHCKHLPPFSDCHKHSSRTVPRWLWNPWACWPLVIHTHFDCDYFTDPGERAPEFSTDVFKNVWVLSVFPTGKNHNSNKELNPMGTKYVCDWGIRWKYRIATEMGRTAIAITIIFSQKQAFLENSVALD